MTNDIIDPREHITKPSYNDRDEEPEDRHQLFTGMTDK